MLRFIAPLLLVPSAFPAAAATASSTTGDSILSPSTSWWEKVTVTMAGDGKTQSCRYEASTSGKGKSCDVEDTDADHVKAPSQGEITKITFERRFNPGPAPVVDAMQIGDKLLGKQVMALAIDGTGKVSGCKIVDISGDMTPAYGCDEASSEQFQRASQADVRRGFMTILIYGHSEHVV